MILGVASGFLNLIPFLGAIFGALIPVGAELLQNQPLAPLAVTVVTVVGLHAFSVNFLIPKIIGQRVSISPVAATMGIPFWGWLWGLIGVLLAVPLTALVKIVADSNPSLSKIGQSLGGAPCGSAAMVAVEPRASHGSLGGVRNEEGTHEYAGKLKDTRT